MSVPDLRLLSAIKIAQEFFNDHRVDQLCWSHHESTSGSDRSYVSEKFESDWESGECMPRCRAELFSLMRHKTRSLPLPKSLKSYLLCVTDRSCVQYDDFLSTLQSSVTRKYFVLRPKKWTKFGTVCGSTIFPVGNEMVEMFDRISDFEEKVVWFLEVCWTCKESVIKSLWESLTRNEQNQVISKCLDWEIEYDWCPYWLNQFADDSMKTELANTYLDCLGQIGFLASGINFHAFWHSVHCSRLDAAIFFYDKLTPEEKSIHCRDHATCSHLFVHVFRNLTENCFPFAWRILQLPCLPVRTENLIGSIPPGIYDRFLKFALGQVACVNLILKIRCQIIETLFLLAPDGVKPTLLLSDYTGVIEVMLLYMFGSDETWFLVKDEPNKKMAVESNEFWREIELECATISRTQRKESVEVIAPDDAILLAKILSLL